MSEFTTEHVNSWVELLHDFWIYHRRHKGARRYFNAAECEQCDMHAYAHMGENKLIVRPLTDRVDQRRRIQRQHDQ